MLNISPTLLGDLSKSTYNNLSTDSQAFAHRTLAPWTRRIGSQVAATLGIDITWDVSSVVTGDRKTEAETDSILVAAGIMTPNEIREKYGLDPLPDPEPEPTPPTAPPTEVDEDA